MIDDLRPNISQDFFELQKIISKTCGLTCANVKKSTESAEYGACTFDLGLHRIVFRTGKTTPTKIGQFVTLWKRIDAGGPIMPYDMADSIDLFIITVRNENHFGCFVFPKSILYEKGIISKNAKGGKRAIRLYPAWDITKNPQAERTQDWQRRYFFEIHQDGSVDDMLVKKLVLNG